MPVGSHTSIMHPDAPGAILAARCRAVAGSQARGVPRVCYLLNTDGTILSNTWIRLDIVQLGRNITVNLLVFLEDGAQAAVHPTIRHTSILGRYALITAPAI